MPLVRSFCNSVKPVLEIATTVGFNNSSNFKPAPKHYYDQTPSQYRKTHSNKKKKQKELAKWLTPFLSANFSFSLPCASTESKES